MDHETSDDIKRHFDEVAEGLRAEMGALAVGLRGEIQDLRRNSDVVAEGLRAEIRDVKRHSDVVADGLRTDIRDVKRHSDVVAESLRGEIRLVAEGVAGFDQKFTMEFVKVREEIGEVKTLLQVSYGDLGRRVQALEGRPSSG